MMKRLSTSALVLLAAGALVATPASAQYSESTTLCSGFSSIIGAPGASILATVSACDDCTQSVTLPFSFPLYGDTPVTTVQVASNGQINMSATDTNANCCTADPVVIGGAYTLPRIAVFQEDLTPNNGGDIWTRNTGSSFIISWENVTFFGGAGIVNAQAELFPNGHVDIRWSNSGGAGQLWAVGLESDTHAPPWAHPATGAPFQSGANAGVAPSGTISTGCRRFFLPPPEDCDNGADDDLDTFVDCLDISCFGDPACAPCGPGGGGGDCDLTPVIDDLVVLEAKAELIDDNNDLLVDIQADLAVLEAKAELIDDNGAAIAALQADVDALGTQIAQIQATLDGMDLPSVNAKLCELIRLMHTPAGNRTSECDGVQYEWSGSTDGP